MSESRRNREYQEASRSVRLPVRKRREKKRLGDRVLCVGYVVRSLRCCTACATPSGVARCVGASPRPQS